MPLTPVTDPAVIEQLNGQSGLGGFGRRVGGGIQRGLGAIGAGMFPGQPGVDPDAQKAAQNQALMSFGLGLMAAGNRPGASFGSAMGEAYSGASQGYGGAMNNAFQRTLATKQEERQTAQDKAQMERHKTEQARLQAERDYQLKLDERKQKNWEAEQASQAEARKQSQANSDRQFSKPQYQVVNQPSEDGTMIQPTLVDMNSGQQKPFGQAYTNPKIAENAARIPKVTGEHATAAGYYQRMAAAEQSFSPADASGKAQDFVPSYKDFAAAQSLLVGGPTQAVMANNIMSPQGQQYYQAAADWVRAKLRKESGATIKEEEMIGEIRTFFPIPGDPPAVIEQKRKARQRATQSLKIAAGPAGKMADESLAMEQGGAPQSAGGWSAVKIPAGQ